MLNDELVQHAVTDTMLDDLTRRVAETILTKGRDPNRLHKRSKSSGARLGDHISTVLAVGIRETLDAERDDEFLRRDPSSRPMIDSSASPATVATGSGQPQSSSAGGTQGTCTTGPRGNAIV